MPPYPRRRDDEDPRVRSNSHCPLPAAGGTLYGLEEDQAVLENSSLFVVNQATGAATEVGELAGHFATMGGLAYDSSTDTLYGSDLLPFSNDPRLVEIDPATAAVTPVGFFPGAATRVAGLAYDSLDDVLYGSNQGDDTLVIVDRTDASLTVVGPLGSSLSGLAFDPATDTLYGIDGLSLWIVDQATAALTLVGPHAIAGAFSLGLDFETDSARLFATNVVFASNADALYEIDTATGLATTIGPTGGPGLGGLASIPSPEEPPSVLEIPTLGTVGLALLVLLLGIGGALTLWRLGSGGALAQ